MQLHFGPFLTVGCFFQSLCQLIGAGGGFEAAGGAFQSGDHFSDFHALHQRADTFQVAVAAANVLNIVKLAIFDLKQNSLGTSAFCFIFVLHDLLPFLCNNINKFCVYKLD